MESNSGTLKKKIGALCTVTACSQFLKHNRKHSTSLKYKKEEMLGKTMAGLET